MTFSVPCITQCVPLQNALHTGAALCLHYTGPLRCALRRPFAHLTRSITEVAAATAAIADPRVTRRDPPRAPRLAPLPAPPPPLPAVGMPIVGVALLLPLPPALRDAVRGSVICGFGKAPPPPLPPFPVVPPTLAAVCKPPEVVATAAPPPPPYATYGCWYDAGPVAASARCSGAGASSSLNAASTTSGCTYCTTAVYQVTGRKSVPEKHFTHQIISLFPVVAVKQSTRIRKPQ